MYKLKPLLEARVSQHKLKPDYNRLPLNKQKAMDIDHRFNF